MSTVEWLVAALYPIVLVLPFLLIVKYIKEIAYCKKTRETLDNGVILKLIAASIVFIVGIFIFIMQYLA